MHRRAGYVLVGGRSSRFGRDKALIDIDGRPLVSLIAEKVRAAADTVTLVGSPERYGHLRYRVIPDQVRNFGPVAGIVAALEDSAADWNLIVACDMPRLRVDFLELLFSRAESCGRDALVPLSSGGREEPLCAVYSKRLAGPFRQALRSGEAKITRALSGMDVHYLLPPEYHRIDPSGEVFMNVNTRADLRL